MIKVSENYKKAFVELEAVLKCLNYDDYNKIPKNLINEIEQNKDKEYKYEYNETLEYYKWNFMPETKALLYNIFKNYLATEKQIEDLRRKELIEINKLEEEKKKKYNTENIFKNSELKNSQQEKKDKECNKIIKYKESFIKRIFRKIKSIFKWR